MNNEYQLHHRIPNLSATDRQAVQAYFANDPVSQRLKMASAMLQTRCEYSRKVTDGAEAMQG